MANLIDISSDESAAAAQLGVSVRSARVLAAGAGTRWDWRDYGGPYVDSYVKLAQEFALSERTIARWKASGMPIETDGRYNVSSIREWARRKGLIPSTSADLPTQTARGDLARAIFKMLRVDLRHAVIESLEEVKGLVIGGVDAGHLALVVHACRCSLAKQLQPFCLADHEIEEVVQECWAAV